MLKIPTHAVNPIVSWSECMKCSQLFDWIWTTIINPWCQIISTKFAPKSLTRLFLNILQGSCIDYPKVIYSPNPTILLVSVIIKENFFFKITVHLGDRNSFGRIAKNVPEFSINRLDERWTDRLFITHTYVTFICTIIFILSNLIFQAIFFWRTCFAHFFFSSILKYPPICYKILHKFE